MHSPVQGRRFLRAAATVLPAFVVFALLPPFGAGAASAATVADHLDADTRGIEGGTGRWTPWFQSTVARSTSEATAGSASMRVNVTGLYGWGVTLSNWPGFTASPGPKQLGLSAKKGAGLSLGVVMHVKWRNDANVDLQTDVVKINSLTTTWQQGSAEVVAPAGTTKVWVEVTSGGVGSGLLGDHVFLDEIVVAPKVTTTTTAAPTTVTVTNRLTPDTQGAEGGTGNWAPWFSTSVGRSTTQAKAGTAGHQINVIAPYGWAVTLNNWPGAVVAPGSKRIGFWAMKGAGENLGVTMNVHWRNSQTVTLKTDVVTIPSLTGAWQQATADVVAPAGTATAWVELMSNSGATSGAAGNVVLVDEVMVGDITAAPVTTTTVAPATTTTTVAPTTVTTTPPPPSNAPSTPPAQICGSSVLNGPATPPAGAVRVDVGQNVYDATMAHPAGTTFWLAPGVHKLEASMFAQVAPKTGNTYIGAPGAVLDGQGVNRYAFTHVAPHNATGVTIKHLTIRNFVAPLSEGVVNQGAGPGWVVEYNTIRDNGGAGVYIGSDNVVRYNCLTANSQYGFSMYRSEGLANITLDHNEISYNNTGDWEAKIAGCGCTGGGKFWDVNGATVTNNWVHHNKSVGLWADTNNTAFRIEGNYISDNDGQAIWYEISYNFLIKDNTIKRNTWVTGREFAARGDYFPVGTIYIAESGGDARVSPTYASSEIVGNVLEDNWGGVALWESANRFCNSPNNTSTGYCTKGGAATIATCAQPSIAAEPYYSDCRWKTQNITVHHNVFRHNAAAVGCDPFYCGKQALFSDFGSSPDWMPYKGDTIQKAIAFDRNNRFHDNAYFGDWSFTASDRTLAGGFGAWQAAPYSQDAGSTKA